jgi:hypothetical protein
MNKAKRRELLKASYRGTPYQTSGKVRPKEIKPGKRRYDPFSLALVTTEVKWVTRCNETEKPLVQPKRRRGVSPLTKIAQQLPRKLKRVV